MTQEAVRSSVDVVVVGSGAAGLAAAIEVTRAGRQVLVLESESTYGGASILSGGGCCIVGTPVQEALGFSDNLELALADWAARGGPTADLEWAERYLRASRTDVYDWLESLAVDWEPRLAHEAGNSVPRWHKPRGGGGVVMAALRSELNRVVGPGWLHVDSPVSRLVADGNRVIGVDLESGGRLRARTTVVATGGFVSNRDMLAEHSRTFGPIENLLSGSGPSTVGRGHKLLADVGAGFCNLEAIWFYPVGTVDPRERSGRGLMVLGLRNEIWVNALGRRFCDETQRGHSEGGLTLLAQPGQFSWGIFDAKEASRLELVNNGYYDSGGTMSNERREAFLRDSPDVFTASTIEELARLIDVEAGVLGATVEAYNSAISSGREVDEVTGKDLRGRRPIEHAPYTALRYRPLAQKNLGGVWTDHLGAVRRPDGSTIGGLSAAGEVAGMAGGHINGASGLEGTMFGPCLYSGRLAGASAALKSG